MEFGKQLKKFRESLGLTQKEFGEKVGLGRTKISDLENGGINVTLKTVEKISEATNTPISYWIENNANLSIEQFDGLMTVIDTLIKVGEINRNGEISEEGKALIMKMLESEVKLYISKKG